MSKYVELDFSNPLAWSFVAVTYHYATGPDGEIDPYGEAVLDDLQETFNQSNLAFMYPSDARALSTAGARFNERGTCDHCGAHFNYGAVFKNEQGQHAIVGNICALNNLHLTAHQYADKKLRKAVEASLERAKTLATKAANQLVLDAQVGEVWDALRTVKHPIISDILGYYLLNGKVSEKQEALVVKISREIKQREIENANKPHAPVVTGKGVTISGKVICSPT